tara:strand:+ start:2514 stop:2678 length:165 start_codon:yes stop_codon:yes gene_type:complete
MVFNKRKIKSWAKPLKIRYAKTDEDGYVDLKSLNEDISYTVPATEPSPYIGIAP